jgi:hypothetical protein
VVVYVVGKVVGDYISANSQEIGQAIENFIDRCGTIVGNLFKKLPQPQTQPARPTPQATTIPTPQPVPAPRPNPTPIFDPLLRSWPQPQPRPTGTPAPPGTPTPDSGRYLYHYTEAASIPSILATGLRPSIQDPGNPRSDAQWGNGQYFTDLTPQEASSATRYQVSRAIFNIPWHWGRPPNLPTIGWLKVRVQGLPIRREDSLFTQRFEHRSIYRHPSTINLPVAGRVVATGTVQFQPSESGYR